MKKLVLDSNFCTINIYRIIILPKQIDERNSFNSPGRELNGLVSNSGDDTELPKN